MLSSPSPGSAEDCISLEIAIDYVTRIGNSSHAAHSDNRLFHWHILVALNCVRFPALLAEVVSRTEPEVDSP
jgi:hypothetical protein